MKVHFYIRYYTRPGEALFITGNTESLGHDDVNHALPMIYHNNQFWYGTIDIDPAEHPKITYSYIFRNITEGHTVIEGGQGRLIDISKTGVDEIQLVDAWIPPGEFENVFYTDPFRKVLLKDNETNVKIRSPKIFTHIFKVRAPLLKKNEAVCLLGGSSVTGEWNTATPLVMKAENDWWTLKLNMPPETLPLTYKYGVYHVKDKQFITYEAGENRSLFADPAGKKITIVHDGFLRVPNNVWKGAGVSIPVFSLRSDNSFGAGEFNDLKLFSDWAKKAGLKMIQLLPVNDTISTHSWKDSYPYASISAFALHPLYLNIDSVAGKSNQHLIRPLRKKQKQLNDLETVDYEQVLKFKLSVLKEIFQLDKDKFLKDKSFAEFFEANRHWLVPYAAFSYLRDRNGTAEFDKWKIYAVYDKAAIEKYVSPRAKHYHEIAFVYYLQFHLHRQLTDAVEHAHKNGIIIKGDIPIGIGRYSCEAWENPELFNMDQQSGAPPDDFAVKGQNWLFPTYNWQKMAEDHFDWWKRRFAQMSNYFDAFRIDHILGFFRIWTIPVDSVQGIMGYFNPAIPVHIYEFAQRGTWFNFHRFCKPYITDAVLWELFGPNKDKFFPYLESVGNHQYVMREEFSTQKKVEQHFLGLEQTVDNQHIRDGLYELISNVILFEVPDTNGHEFHFRISMEHTTSFRHLDHHTQQQLRSLYINYFYERQDYFWRNEALKKLPSLKRSTNMLICGEDLGMVPRTVPEVMNLLGILSLEVQRMPKDPRRTFFHPADAPYLSVVTPSTHDMSPIRSWWEEDQGVRQQFFNHELGQWGEAPAVCEAWISKAIILQHFYSPAMWSIFQLQDLLGMNERLRKPDHLSERINVPAITNHYWNYRMHIPIEQLLREKDLIEELSKYAEASGR